MHHQNTFLKKHSTGIRLSLLVTWAVFLAAIPLQSQDKKQTDDQDVIKVTSNLVSLDVIVKDKKGKPITDLKAEDFTVTEPHRPNKNHRAQPAFREILSPWCWTDRVRN